MTTVGSCAAHHGDCEGVGVLVCVPEAVTDAVAVWVAVLVGEVVVVGVPVVVDVPLPVCDIVLVVVAVFEGVAERDAPVEMVAVGDAEDVAVELGVIVGVAEGGA